MDLAFALDEAKGYVYCAHCDNVVSRSTYERHERKRYLALSNSTKQSTIESCDLDSETSSSPDDEG